MPKEFYAGQKVKLQGVNYLSCVSHGTNLIDGAIGVIQKLGGNNGAYITVGDQTAHCCDGEYRDAYGAGDKLKAMIETDELLSFGFIAEPPQANPLMELCCDSRSSHGQ